MNTNGKRLIIILSLTTLGSLLLLLPQWLFPPIPTQSIIPLPSWAALPTRNIPPTPTATPDPLIQPLNELHEALLRRDYVTANIAWDKAYAMAPTSAAILREGARLALARDNLTAAERRIWKALRLGDKDAETWLVLGNILAQQGELKPAEQAYAIAETLSPELRFDVFPERWRAARRTYDTHTLSGLAQSYSSTYPDDILTFYYRSAVLLNVGDAETVITQLTQVLSTTAHTPAVLWYTLGQAYLMRSAYTETLTVLDVAGNRFAQGDMSLYLASDDPLYDLNLALTRAYLGFNTPHRCVDAEPLARRISVQSPELTSLLTQALQCQTPTPTWTPWIPNEQPTPTP